MRIFLVGKMYMPCREGGFKDEEPLEDIWANFKAIAKENDFQERIRIGVN